jgi:hypothetical protein
MVFVALIELGVKGSVFVIQQTYYLGRYLIWGSQKTREQLLEERFQEQIDRENRIIEELRTEIKELKNTKIEHIEHTQQHTQPIHDVCNIHNDESNIHKDECNIHNDESNIHKDESNDAL